MPQRSTRIGWPERPTGHSFWQLFEFRSSVSPACISLLYLSPSYVQYRKTSRPALCLSLQLVQLIVLSSSALIITAESRRASCFDTLDRSYDRPDRFRGPAAPLHDLRIVSIITRQVLHAKQIVVLYLVKSDSLCVRVFMSLPTRLPNYSPSLQCTLSSSLKWSSKSSSPTTEASSTFALSSAAFDSRRMLAASR